MRHIHRAALAVLLACGFNLGAVGQESKPASELLRQALAPQLTASSTLKIDSRDLPLALAQFYAGRDWAPVWDDARFAVLLQQLGALAGDGLDPEDYGLSSLRQYQQTNGDSARQAKREQLATRAYLLALVHLYHGKVDPVQLDAHWNFDMRQIDPEQGLNRAREAVEKNTIADIFQRARPTLAQYQALRKALADARASAQQGGWPRIPEGAVLKPGMDDPRVPLLRQRLQLAGLLTQAGEGSHYDPALVEAVQRFQKESYQEADGVIGPGTLRVLNVPITQRIDQLRANLERLRWFRSEYQNDFVLVDIAGYHAYYIHDNQRVWSSRVQIGKAYRQTPVFKADITYITLNPTWTVPPTIFKQDSLPAIRRSRAYLTRNRIRVLDAQGKELAPSAVNWSNPGNITLRQDAGPGNSLGQLVIRFPNPYSVYMHDTPHQDLFSAKQRAFSSGCIRLEKVHELAVMLLNDPQHWSREALETELATNKTRNVTLAHKVPVLIAYWTVDIGKDGYVAYKPDIYGQDPKIIQALDDHGGAVSARRLDHAPLSMEGRTLIKVRSPTITLGVE